MKNQNDEEKTKYLTKIDILEKYKQTRNIIESPASIFDLIIIKANEKQAALYLNWNFSTEIGHTMIKQMSITNDTISIHPYTDGEAVKSNCRLYEFGHESIEQIVTYLSLEDELLNPILDHLDKYALAYNNCRVGIENNGQRHLEIKLLDDAGEIPIDAYIIAKELLTEEPRLIG